MDLQTYLKNREELERQPKPYRDYCHHCFQPSPACYCKHIQKFDPQIEFVILIHPLEMRKRIATGRMAHLCLLNSHFIRDHIYTNNYSVNKIIADPHRQCVVLYPGKKSINLANLNLNEHTHFFERNRKLTIFVIDGTWATAKTTMNQSLNLFNLPRICFTPEKLSQFRVRKQPNALCYSTIEAIHQTIELLGPSVGFKTEDRAHDNLLEVFEYLVENQLSYVKRSHELNLPSRYKNYQRA